MPRRFRPIPPRRRFIRRPFRRRPRAYWGCALPAVFAILVLAAVLISLL